MNTDMSPEAVSTRLRKMGELCNLRTEYRLETKIDMSPSAVSRRLRVLSELTSLCIRLSRHLPVDTISNKP